MADSWHFGTLLDAGTPFPFGVIPSARESWPFVLVSATGDSWRFGARLNAGPPLPFGVILNVRESRPSVLIDDDFPQPAQKWQP